MQFIKLFFWITFLAVFYSYLFYPLLLKVLSLFKKPNPLFYLTHEQLPLVSVLIPAFNEEKVIGEKMESILKSNYPPASIEIIVGSDNSTDHTNAIISSHAAADKRIKVVIFENRTGKVIIMNELVKKASNPILILTDANVMFNKDTIYELVKNFKNEKIALVDSNIVNTGIRKDGISLQEKTYIKAEVYVKYLEGLIWGSMMGPFGGCYAMRKSFYSNVPVNFLVDDFYLNMKVLTTGGKCMNELKAIVYEDVSNDPYIEFKRKVRIAAGSFQNLFLFLPVLFKINAVSFCFLSHKVLRWMGPFLILSFFLCALTFSSSFFFFIKWITVLIMISPLLDFLSRKLLKINFTLLKYPAHFITTNVALFLGFFKYLSGIKSSIWQPTKRYQK